MSSWPVTLQQKLEVNGFQKSMGNTRVFTDMAVGPAKVRSRFTDAVDVYTCQVTLDFDDVATFEQFYKTTLGNGSLPFTFADPFTGVDREFRFSPSQDPVIRPLGGRVFTLNMSWEALP